jgi:casein kinase I family protein HRR25
MKASTTKSYGNYKVLSKLGLGAFSVIYKATHQLTSQEVALKVGKLNRVSCQEVSLMETLQKYPGFPQVYDSGIEKGLRYIAMELLGQSTEELFNVSAEHFDIATTVGIVTQGISHLETLHKAGYIHRDVIPEHLIYKLGAKPRRNSPIYLTDFGLARQLSYSLNLMSGAKVAHIVGNARFVGVRAHMNSSHSKADDLESMIYIAIYFLKGELPWDFLMDFRGDQWMNIKCCKEEFINRRCPQCPSVFGELLTYLLSLRSTERPDYNYIRLKIQQLEVVQPSYPFEITQSDSKGKRVRRRKSASLKRNRSSAKIDSSKSRRDDPTSSMVLCSPEDEGALTPRDLVGPRLDPEARQKISRAMVEVLQERRLSTVAFSTVRKTSS